MRGYYDRQQIFLNIFFCSNLSASVERVCLHKHTVLAFDESFIRCSPKLLLSFAAHVVFTSFPFFVKVTSRSMRHAASVAQAQTFTAPRRLSTRFSGGISRVTTFPVDAG